MKKLEILNSTKLKKRLSKVKSISGAIIIFLSIFTVNSAYSYFISGDYKAFEDGSAVVATSLKPSPTARLLPTPTTSLPKKSELTKVPTPSITPEPALAQADIYSSEESKNTSSVQSSTSEVTPIVAPESTIKNEPNCETSRDKELVELKKQRDELTQKKNSLPVIGGILSEIDSLTLQINELAKKIADLESKEDC